MDVGGEGVEEGTALAANATMYVVRRYQAVLHRFAAALITCVVKRSAAAGLQHS